MQDPPAKPQAVFVALAKICFTGAAIVAVWVFIGVVGKVMVWALKTVLLKFMYTWQEELRGG